MKPPKKEEGVVSEAFLLSEKKKEKRFGKFILYERIGRGGMGMVFRAKQIELDRMVALKILLHEDDGHDVERFYREARAVARLRHPNIVPIHEFGKIDGRHYFTMDLIEGGRNLRQHLENYEARAESDGAKRGRS